MEMDLLVDGSFAESQERGKALMESAVREVQLSTLMASSESAYSCIQLSQVSVHVRDSG